MSVDAKPLRLVELLQRPFRSLFGSAVVFGIAFTGAQMAATVLVLHRPLPSGTDLLLVLALNALAGAACGALVWWTMLRPLQQKAAQIRATKAKSGEQR